MFQHNNSARHTSSRTSSPQPTQRKLPTYNYPTRHHPEVHHRNNNNNNNNSQQADHYGPPAYSDRITTLPLGYDPTQQQQAPQAGQATGGRRGNSPKQTDRRRTNGPPRSGTPAAPLPHNIKQHQQPPDYRKQHHTPSRENPKPSRQSSFGSLFSLAQPQLNHLNSTPTLTTPPHTLPTTTPTSALGVPPSTPPMSTSDAFPQYQASYPPTYPPPGNGEQQQGPLTPAPQRGNRFASGGLFSSVGGTPIPPPEQASQTPLHHNQHQRSGQFSSSLPTYGHFGSQATHTESSNEPTSNPKEQPITVKNNNTKIFGGKTLSPPMFSLVVQGGQPIKDYSYMRTKYTFTIPSTQALGPTWACVYLTEFYRIQPYSFVEVFTTTSDDESAWNPVGKLDFKIKSIFLQLPEVPKGRPCHIGMEIVGHLPRELKPSYELQHQHSTDAQLLEAVDGLLQKPGNFDVVEARRLLLYLPCTPSTADELVTAAENRLARLEEIQNKATSGTTVVCQLNGVLDWIQEQLLGQHRQAIVASGDEQRANTCIERLTALRQNKGVATTRNVAFAQATFGGNFAALCGDIMSSASSATNRNPRERLDQSQEMINTFEKTVAAECQYLEKLYHHDVVAACLPTVLDKVNNFFGWMESMFIDNAPSEMRQESKALTLKINQILKGFEKGRLWYKDDNHLLPDNNPPQQANQQPPSTPPTGPQYGHHHYWNGH